MAKLPVARVLLLGLLCGCAPASPDIDPDGPEPTDGRDDLLITGTVADAAASSCSTASIKGLSQQIIDEAACADPTAYAKLPDLPNLVIADNVFPYIEEPARDALVEALKGSPGKTLHVSSMLRTVAQQYLVYRWYQKGTCGVALAAKPGKSNHETGLAFDTPDYATWKSALTTAGFKWFGSSDKPHFDYVGDGAESHTGADVAAFQRLWNQNHPEDKISEDGQYGPQTEARLKQSPAQGFDKGASCAPADPGTPSDPPSDPGTPSDPGPSTSWWTPAPGTTWQLVLSTTPAINVDVQVYDFDGFDNDAALVQKLHAAGRKAICYFSAGTYEDWRPDAGSFPASVRGKPDQGWAGENWLDIRRLDVLGPIMKARLDMCKQKGFDGVDPDNVDGYQNDTGFSLTYADQLKFNQFLAAEAHARGLAVGLKNDPDQVPDLVGSFDWVLTEDCFDQGFCPQVKPFITAGKPVFAVEYTDTGMTTSKFCPSAGSMKFSGILKHRELDDWIQACP